MLGELFRLLSRRLEHRLEPAAVPCQINSQIVHKLVSGSGESFPIAPIPSTPACALPLPTRCRHVFLPPCFLVSGSVLTIALLPGPSISESHLAMVVVVTELR